jgi:pSer/pThr/pTyr-binding forkhead associated (FHA) protein
MARLVVINQSLAGSVHNLGEAWATIGRADGNSFQLAEASVSGRHCEVRVRGEELVVRDLSSTNGTFVGGQKISEAVVKPGQTLRLGDVELCFEPGAPLNSKTPATQAALATRKPAVAPEKTAPPESNSGPEQKLFHVLFIDDSLAFLELFTSLCAEYAQRTWQIHTATSADRALAVLQDKLMDLVVLDIGMPLLDGLQLLGILNRRYPGMKMVVMTGGATESKRADALANGAELFLEKPMTAEGTKTAFNVLNDLVSWNREGFTGALRHVGLQEVIQMECNGRHSSILEIRNSELRGEIYIEAGVLTHAAVGLLTGELAFYRLLSLKGGEFQVKTFKKPPQLTVQSSWEFLLMDAARANDEETVRLKNPAVAQPKPKEQTASTSPDEEFIVMATYDGKWQPGDDAKK